jgi:ABC-type transporter Mla MlaB component
MASKDTPSGLLARVANFVRSPSGVSAASAAEELGEGETGKQAIKRMIERKAHNDAVRQREFSQLRKLRDMSPAAASELVARASFFQETSGFPVSGTGTSTTLKKIDEIEAQMSKQWWKGQPVQPAQPVKVAELAKAPAATEPELPESFGAAPGESQIDTCNHFAPTQPTHLDEPAAPAFAKAWATAPAPPTPPAPQAASRVQTLGFAATGSSAFSNSKLVSIDMGDALSDAVLEDAAIRFANSDDAGAEAVLAAAIRGEAASARAKEAWTLALLDMLRVTRQQASYERLALDYAQSADQAASRSFSATRQSTLSAALLPASGSDLLDWQAPVLLDMLALDPLRKRVINDKTQIRLDWQQLKSITPDAALALADLIGVWCDLPLSLQFDGTEMLDAVLRVNTPVGDPQAPRRWWKLRLTNLRALGDREEFERVSMDFCITYERSPPTWQPPRCRRVFDLQPQPRRWADEPTHPATLPVALADLVPFLPLDTPSIKLSGELLGSAAEALKPLQRALLAGGDLRVDGQGLVRVDFSAAGSILNWVASAQVAGSKIEFCYLPDLVAAFFNLIGINEHARVSPRNG